MIHKALRTKPDWIPKQLQKIHSLNRFEAKVFLLALLAAQVVKYGPYDLNIMIKPLTDSADIIPFWLFLGNYFLKILVLNMRFGSECEDKVPVNPMALAIINQISNRSKTYNITYS